MEPQPKAEIIVEILPDVRTLYISCASADSKQWVKENAPKFGRLKDAVTYDYELIVSILYDVHEVERYIRNMG